MRLAISKLLVFRRHFANCLFALLLFSCAAVDAAPQESAIKGAERVLELDQRSHLVGRATTDIAKNWIYIDSKDRGFELYSEGPKWETIIFRRTNKLCLRMPIEKVKAQTTINGAYGAFSVLTDLKAPIGTSQYIQDGQTFEEVSYRGQSLEKSYFSPSIEKSTDVIVKVILTSLKWNITREQNTILCKMASWPASHDIPFKTKAFFRDGSVSMSLQTLSRKSRMMSKPVLPDIKKYESTDFLSKICYPSNSTEIINDLLDQ